MFNGDREEMLRERDAPDEVFDKFTLVQRIGLKENAIESLQLPDDLLPFSPDQPDIWMSLAPGAEVTLDDIIVALNDGVRADAALLQKSSCHATSEADLEDIAVRDGDGLGHR